MQNSLLTKIHNTGWHKQEVQQKYTWVYFFFIPQQTNNENIFFTDRVTSPLVLILFNFGFVTVLSCFQLHLQFERNLYRAQA